MDIQKLKEEYNIGQSIFEKLFNLSDKELKLKLIDILGEDNHMSVLNNNCTITRVIKNEIPEYVLFEYYDSIKVDYKGVHLISEHGIELLPVKFNKYFKLE